MQVLSQFSKDLWSVSDAILYSATTGLSARFRDAMDSLLETINTQLQGVVRKNEEAFTTTQAKLAKSIEEAMEPLVQMAVNLKEADDKSAFLFSKLASSYLGQIMGPMSEVTAVVAEYHPVVDETFTNILSDINTRLDSAIEGSISYSFAQDQTSS